MQIVKRKRTQATPHLYIDFIPFTTGSKRGLETRVSLKMALEALGFPLNMRYADTTEGRLIPIPQPRPAEDFFFGCRADGRSVLIVRFAAVWATVWQRFCLKAVMADIAEIVVHCVLHFLVMWKFICHQDIFQSQGSPRYW